MSTGEKIKALRKEKKWSQDDLSKAIGVHSKHISRYENNKVTPSPETLRKMADVFDVSTDYLLQDNVPRDEKIKINDPELNEEDQATIKNVIKAMIMKNQMERVISQ